MLYCDDAQYRKWWPEAHFRFHTLEYKPGHIGNRVFFDELVGTRRLRFQAVITEYIPDRRIVWQMKQFINLPAWLSLEFEDTPEGLRITHKLSAGFEHAGRLLDPLIRCFFSPAFEQNLSQHALIEFTKLASMLRE